VSRKLFTLGAVTAALLLVAAPVLAVQTSTYKLAATGPRTKIVHGYGTGSVHDSFIVGNLTDTPLTLMLDVVSATKQANGDYALGQPDQAFAQKVRIPDHEVALAAHEQRTLSVDIDRPAHTDQPLYAAITAQPQSRPTGGIGVQTRLALLVEVAPQPEHVSRSRVVSVARVLAVIIAIALIAGGSYTWWRRRRREAIT